jgi:hypothetical protein
MLLLAFLFTVSVYGDCGDLKTVGTFKKCTGIGLFLSGPDKTSFNRENPGGNPVPWVSNNYDFCKAQCEYVGMPGCCEYQNDHDYCYFYLSGSTKSDRSQYKYKPPHSTKVITYASRHASMCTYDSSEYVMLPYNRKTGCEWNGVDKEGRSEKSNSVTLAQCEAFCLQKPDCMFMTLSANGHCRTYKTCNYHNVNGGASTMKQKAVKGSTAASISAGSASACANDDSKSPTGNCDSFYQMYKSAGMDMCDADANFKKTCCATCSKAGATEEAAVGLTVGESHGYTIEAAHLKHSFYMTNKECGLLGLEWKQTTLRGSADYDWYSWDAEAACGGKKAKGFRYGENYAIKLCCSKVAAGEETAVGFLDDAFRNVRGECIYGGQRIEGKCDTRPGFSDSCNSCTFGYTDTIWFNNWCCTNTDAINPKAHKCYCPSNADGSMQFAVQNKAVKTTDVAVYGLAFIGFGVVVFGAYKHYTGGKTHGEHTQIL